MDGEVGRYKEGETEVGSSQPDANFHTHAKTRRPDAGSLHLSIYLFTYSFIHLSQSIIKPTLLYLHLEC